MWGVLKRSREQCFHVKYWNMYRHKLHWIKKFHYYFAVSKSNTLLNFVITYTLLFPPSSDHSLFISPNFWEFWYKGDFSHRKTIMWRKKKLNREKTAPLLLGRKMLLLKRKTKKNNLFPLPWKNWVDSKTWKDLNMGVWTNCS